MSSESVVFHSSIQPYERFDGHKDVVKSFLTLEAGRRNSKAL